MPNGKAGSVFDQAEEQTQRILADMENSLRLRLAEDTAPFADDLRMQFIHLAMWPPVSQYVQSFLELLGDSAEARRRLAFLMPLVEWMSAPFLFPLETGGSPEQQAQKMNKVFGLMAKLQKQGFTATLDNVGDASLSPEDARKYRDYYLTLIRTFIASDSAYDLNMSIKLSALAHDLDSAIAQSAAGQAKRREIVNGLSDLLKTAAQATDKNIFLRIDMEEYAYKDLTLRLFREIVENNPSIVCSADGSLCLGVVIQAYLRDSARDVRELIQWARSRNLRVPIRLVKGAYMDHERAVASRQGRLSPVWGNKQSTDANFEAVSACMLLNLDAVVPAFATHNIRTQAHAMALAEAYGLPPKSAEIQMLYGMGDPIKHIIVAMDRPLREYVPAGSLARGLKYAGRRFNELASSDNALAKTMRGDFSGADASAPTFSGEKNIEDSRTVHAFLKQSLALHSQS